MYWKKKLVLISHILLIFFLNKKHFQDGSEQISHGYFGETGYFCLYRKADEDSGCLSFSNI